MGAHRYTVDYLRLARACSLLSWGLGLAFTASAQTDRNWTNASGGIFSNAANWSGGVIPAGDNNSTARFATNGTYTITFDGDGVCRKANLDAINATVTLNLQGNTFNLTNWWDQGPSSGRTNTVLMQNGTLRSGSDFSVAKTGARASFQMTDANCLVTNAGTFAVGNGSGGYGEFVVSAGAVHLQQLAELGNSAGSTGYMRIANGSVRVYGTAASGDTCLNVGDAGEGLLVLDHASALLVTTNKTAAMLAYTGTGNGTVIISNGTWDANSIYVGNKGRGLLVLNGGMLTNRSGNVILSYPTGTGTVVVASPSAQLHSAGGLALGGDAGAGEAVMIVSNGSVSFSRINMGWRAGSIGSYYTQYGGTSRFNGAISSVGDNATSTGTITLAGGWMDFSGASPLGVGNAGRGYLTVSGGRLTAGEIRLASSANSVGRFTMSGGTAVVATLTFFGGTGPSGATAEFIQSGGVLYLGSYQSYTPVSSTTNVLLSGGLWVATNTISTAAKNVNLTLANSPGPGVFTFDTGPYQVSQFGAISGPGSLVKKGSGRLNLQTTNTFTGSLTVEEGTVSLESGDGTLTACPLMTVYADATLAANNRSDKTLRIASGQTLAGSGIVSGNVALAGGIISPGYSPGVLNVSSLTLTTGTLKVEVTDAAGSEGTGWDLIRVGSGSGPVTNLATSANPVEIDLVCSLNTLPGFYGTNGLSWRILDAGSHSGFASNKFTITTANFLPALKTWGDFLVRSNAGDLYLDFQPISNQVDLGVTVLASTNYADAGGVITYTILVSNGSSAVSGGYYVSNTLTASLAYESATTGAVVSGSTVSWALSGLAAGATTTLTVQARPTFTGSTQEVVNVVAASVTLHHGDPVGGNNSATVLVTTVGIPLFSRWVLGLLAATIAYTFYRYSRRSLPSRA